MNLTRCPFRHALAVGLLLAVVPARAATNYAWTAVPIKCYTEYTNGFPGGEGEQHPKGIAGSPAAPDHVYLSIDIAGTWRSTNAGRSWIKNLDEIGRAHV